jgi:hypothetical protein
MPRQWLTAVALLVLILSGQITSTDAALLRSSSSVVASVAIGLGTLCSEILFFFNFSRVLHIVSYTNKLIANYFQFVWATSKRSFSLGTLFTAHHQFWHSQFLHPRMLYDNFKLFICVTRLIICKHPFHNFSRLSEKFSLHLPA